MPTATLPDAATWTKPRLSPVEVAGYRDQGYLLPQFPILPTAEFAALQAHFEVLLAQWTAEGRRPEHMDVPHFRDPTLFRWLLHPAVLDLVEPILGPDLVLFSSHFICKPGGDGRRVPWHEDSAYWGTRLAPMDVVTVWLAIDPARRENGAMKVMPYSHRTGAAGYSPYEPVEKQENVFETRIKPECIDESKAVPCILDPNHCSLHEGRLIHGSEPNTSPLRRCGYTMRFIAASTTYTAKDDGFAIYLARGKDRAGNRYGDPTVQNRTWFEKRGKW